MKDCLVSNLEYLTKNSKKSAVEAAELLKGTFDIQSLISRVEKVALHENISTYQLMFTCMGECCYNKPDFELKMLVLDVDGVMTDGGMYVDSEGREMKKFNTKDGMAIKFLRKKGIPVAFLSSGLNAEIIAYRAQMLDVESYWVGKGPKLPVLEKWCSEAGISIKSVAYIGDDINDKDVMSQVGFAACPADSVSSVLEKADLVLQAQGGTGAVREFVSLFYSDLV